MNARARQISLAAGLGVLACVATSARAEQLRPAPAYFSNMFAYVYAAETLAQWCPSVSVDDARIQSTWLAIFERLEAEGYDVNRKDAGIKDPSEEIGAAVQRWADKRNLSEASEISAVCKAAEAEMAERTAVGQFLKRSAG